MHISFMLISMLFVFSNLILNQAGQSKVSVDEYLVYSAILNKVKISPSDGKRARMVVINNYTTPQVGKILIDEVGQCEKEFLSVNIQSILDDLIAKNHSSFKLYKQFVLNKNYALLNIKEFSVFFDEKGAMGWDDYHKKFPHASGYNTFSRVGFDRRHTTAIVFVEVSCGGNCGYYSFVLLGKRNGVWKIQKEYDCDPRK